MIRTRNKLTVLHDDNGAFADYSNEALDYGRDTFSFTLTSSNDYIYVGFYKPINAFYVEVTTASSTDTTLSAEYYNGTAFTPIAGYHDDSKAFQRSGFNQWDRNQTDETMTTVNAVEQYWYRFRPALDTTAIDFSGLNIVFSDDEDLKREYYEASKWLPSNEISHILTHVASRDEIVQDIRNRGAKKQSGNIPKDITAFDLLDVPQIKLASTYLSLSKMFSNISDDPEDVFHQKSGQYRNLYNNALRVFYIDLDTDDDGIVDTTEKLAVKLHTMVRR